MKQKLIIYVILLLGCSFSAQENISISMKDRISNLFDIEGNHIVLSHEDEIIFFRSLPNSFEEYLYFYSKPHLYKGSKYWLSLDYHFKYLLNLYRIDKSQVLNKIFELSKDGYWDSDYASSLQKILQLEYAYNTSIGVKILNKKPINEVLSFWRFYFDGPHPENYQKDFEELYKRYYEESPRIADLMKQSYEQLLSEHDGHGH